ncbi:MAG TPA: heme ABC exporter ATP-binding protein CcmA [Ktedonobacterales bacterium]
MTTPLARAQGVGAHGMRPATPAPDGPPISTPSGHAVAGVGRAAPLPTSALPLPPPSTSQALAIEVASAGKLYGVRPVLRGVSFSVSAGQTVALFGPNGAGKTTLLRVLATLTALTTGTAAVAGLDVRADAPALRRIVGYVGHQPHVYDDLTARENLLFFARMYGLRDGRERTETLLERVGLRSRGNDRARQLSRGQLQRLALARGILHEPVVLLLDEPDTGLDEEAGALLEDLVRERAERAQTTLLTTHQLARGLALAERALLLAAGRLVHDGPTADLTLADLRALYGDKAKKEAAP